MAHQRTAPGGVYRPGRDYEQLDTRRGTRWLPILLIAVGTLLIGWALLSRFVGSGEVRAPSPATESPNR